jgi:hypothetical protein
MRIGVCYKTIANMNFGITRMSFYGLALQAQSETDAAQNILDHIHETNARDGYSFYENFNTKTGTPNGVAYCAWSAAAGILLQQSLTTNFKILL